MITRYNLDRFDYNKETKLLSQEASTLGLQNVPNQITVYSPKTKRTVLFTLAKNHRDEEGDLTHSEYETTDPVFKNGRLVIWND